MNPREKSTAGIRRCAFLGAWGIIDALKGFFRFIGKRTLGIAMGILSWIILGGVAGLIAYKLTGTHGQGCLMSILLGIAGAVVGGVVFRFLGGAGVTGLNIYSMAVATVGALLVLALSRFLSGKN